MSKRPNESAKLSPEEAAAFRIHQLVEAVGGSKVAGKIADKSARSIERYEFGDVEPPFEVIAKLANHAGWSMEWVAHGTGPQLAGGEAKSGEDSMVMLPRFELKPSAGRGRVAVPDEVLEPSELISFSREWLRRLGVDPDFAHLLVAIGDSMEPLIRDGDMMLVNRKIRMIETAGIYVVGIAGMVVVKRAFLRRDGSLVLKSENSIYPDEVVPYEDLHTVTIEGRVRWAGRSM